MLTSYEFEVAAKNIIITHCKKKYKEFLTIKEIEVVWFGHVLMNKKMILIDKGPNNRMYEVTYNHDTGEIYFDEYNKTHNMTVLEKECITKVEE